MISNEAVTSDITLGDPDVIVRTGNQNDEMSTTRYDLSGREPVEPNHTETCLEWTPNVNQIHSTL